VLGDDDHNEGLVRIFQGIGRFEDAADDGKYPWLELGGGLVLGIVLTILTLGVAPLTCLVPAYTESRLLSKVAWLAWMSLAAFAMTYWRRQRLRYRVNRCTRRRPPPTNRDNFADFQAGRIVGRLFSRPRESQEWSR
jgi:hypothetical protein